MSRPLEHVPPFEAVWFDLESGSWLAPAGSHNAAVHGYAFADRDGHWLVCERDGEALNSGQSDDLESAKRDALAKARELGLCCWFAGEEPMVFETRWEKRPVEKWTLRRSADDFIVCIAWDGGWSTWLRQVSTECAATGSATSLHDAKRQALGAAALAGYRITVVEDGEVAGAPFAIVPWQYWSRDGCLLVALPPTDRYAHAWAQRNGVWLGTHRGPCAGWTHEPSPEHRHPDDPANAKAEVRALIERVGADVVRAVLEEAR